MPNCRAILSDDKKIFLISEINKTKKLIKEKKISKKNVIEPNKFSSFIKKLKKGKIITDHKTCSKFYTNILKKRFIIQNKDDPIYLLKSIKNKKKLIIHLAHITTGSFN